MIDRMILDKRVLRRRLGHRISARKDHFYRCMETALGGLSAEDHIMVFQTFDNTAPHFFGASDPLSASRQGTRLAQQTSDYGLCAVHRRPWVAEKFACNIGITVYHQTHQR
ncbi:hypothetical protein [Pseudomonas sp. REB1044]|uniref:hypothetical protein n=1 Tax=Pseudomonas sp. REB1044 TaxID=2675224 RepID=UPI00315DDC7E